MALSFQQAQFVGVLRKEIQNAVGFPFLCLPKQFGDRIDAQPDAGPESPVQLIEEIN